MFSRTKTTMTTRLGALLLISGASLATASAQEPPSIQYGALTIHGYELREARHDPPKRIAAYDGSIATHAFSWQIVIRGEKFPIRALDPELWVGDVKLVHFERHELADGQELVFEVIDPNLLRAERELQVIYGRDERTRTKLLERLDPEKLVKLPEPQRKDSGIPELEGLTLRSVDVSGRISGVARITSGEDAKDLNLRLAARLESGRLQLLDGTVKLPVGGQGAFTADVGSLPAGTTHVVALRVTGDAALAGADLAALPKGVELLDSKPVGTKPH